MKNFVIEKKLFCSFWPVFSPHACCIKHFYAGARRTANKLWIGQVPQVAIMKQLWESEATSDEDFGFCQDHSYWPPPSLGGRKEADILASSPPPPWSSWRGSCRNPLLMSIYCLMTTNMMSKTSFSFYICSNYRHCWRPESRLVSTPAVFHKKRRLLNV